MFNKDFDELSPAVKVFVAETVKTIEELVLKHGKTCFKKACTELLKNPDIYQWPTGNNKRNTLQLTDEKSLAWQYLVLTLLHDGSINKSISPIYFTEEMKRDDNTVNILYIHCYVALTTLSEWLKTEAYITTALKAVEADLLKAASGEKADLSNKKVTEGTKEKNKGIFKRIPYWIYILTLFFAALLTCLYYLGWLEPIKAFISKILLHK
jgi:hypothetical protein